MSNIRRNLSQNA